MPRRDDLQSILVIGSGPDRDRPGLRVRLLGHPGLPGPGRGGLPGDPGQLQPGHDHDGPRDGRPDLHRAARPRGADRHHREGAARRAAADPRRADGAEPDHGAGRARRPGALRRRGDRGAARGHLDRRGPGPLQGGHGGDRPRGAPLGVRPLAARRRRRSRPRSASRSWCGRASSSAGRGRASPRTRRTSASWRPKGLAASPVGQILVEQSIAGWKEYELEVMRDARRQLRRRLLHRELRPHGRAHGRLHHGGPGADADRRRVPGHARRRLRLPAPGGGRDRRLQRAVRRRARRRAGGSSSR